MPSSSPDVVAGAAAPGAGAEARPALIPLVILDLLLLDPVARLGLRGVRGLSEGLTVPQWALAAVVFAAFVYGEGWLALHRKFSVHVIARLRQLKSERLLLKVFGFLYAASLVGDRPRAMVRAWLGVAAIGAAVLIVKQLPQPYRAMVDVSVAAALLLGIVSLTGRYCVACARRNATPRS
ncbi:MAG: hypothetical protein QM723_08385 [Myxococcaceae bacterium]